MHNLSRLFLLPVFFAFAFSAAAQTKIPAPNDVMGFTPGDDRKLASWSQIVDYFQKLDAASDRVKFETIGKSTMDKPFVFATISAPENLAKLEFYKDIQAKLADPRKIKSNDKTAASLIKQGKTIVLITCGVHSTEVGSTLSSMLIAHKLATASDAETTSILKNTIVLLVPSLNPDGVDIVKNWYDKTLNTPFEGTNPPELYHKYTGHDNNRDWYAFTQVETQLTVDKIHNVWHPQIVHDIHQQGANGARMFVPPYLPPVEPNVPKEIVEGYTELGQYILGEMTNKGFAGMTNNSIYDAWTPARAYSHYHGGVRILSETASARLATPINVKFENLRVDENDNYNPQKQSANFPKPWQGGEWKLRNITDYMTNAAHLLMRHAADNREKWLARFYQIGKEAVRPREKGELYGFKINVNSRNAEILNGILRRGGVEVSDTKVVTNRYKKFNYSYATESFVKIEQPYGSFAKTLIEKQDYPNLKDERSNPIPPYDVTAHSLNLLMNVEVTPIYKPTKFQSFDAKEKGRPGKGGLQEVIGIYKSHIPVMDAGWTDWTINQDFFDRSWGINSKFFLDSDIHTSKLTGKAFVREIDDKGLAKSTEQDVLAQTIIFPDQSPNQMLNGHAKGAMPDEYTGGIGAEGVENLRKFAEAGGTLVFLNRASNFAIEQFKLPVRDVTAGVKRTDFYIPGSILRTELDTTSPIAKNMDKLSIAWFENSPAFEVTDNANVKIIARYPQKTEDILLSGWALGAEKLAGKAALVEVSVGKGKIVLFGFRPQYRGQSLATFPLLFNAITEK